jgi:hypothetical protein
VTDLVAPPRPEAMRDLVRDYVRAVHTTYLDHVAHLPPAERGTLPLVAAGEVTVVAAAARRLHLIATTDPLPAPHGPEVEHADEHRGVAWTVRFFDPSVLPALGVLREDGPGDVRRVLGIANTAYHLMVAVGGGLTGHHARHSGVALANQHAKMLRDLDRIRRALPRDQRTVDELGVCARLGLDRAAALLAGDLTSGRVVAAPSVPAASCVDAVLDDVTR